MQKAYETLQTAPATRGDVRNVDKVLGEEGEGVRKKENQFRARQKPRGG